MIMQRISRNLITKRNFMRSAVRRSDDHDHGGRPGSNIPFDVNNKYKVTLVMTLFITSGMAVPFLAVRHQMTK